MAGAERSLSASLRRGFTVVGLALGALAPAAAHAQLNAEALSVEPAPTAVAGRAMPLVASVRVDPGVGYTLTPYLTQGGVVAGARALTPILVPEPPSGRTVRIEADVPVPADAAGVFTVAIVLDAADAVTETNELDNVAIAASVTRLRPERPDPRVTVVAPQAARARPAEPLSVELTVHNAGELDATVEVSAHLSRDDEVAPTDPELGRTTIDVAAGATVVRNLAGTVPAGLAPGRYGVGAVVDPVGALDEVSETNNTALAGARVIVFEDTLTLDTPSIPDTTVGLPYHVALQASGGDGSYDFGLVSGDLPDGLTLEQDGVLSGTPTRSSNFTFTVQVASDGKQDSQTYSMEVFRTDAPLTIATTEATAGFLNMPYEQGLVAGGGEAPYTWALVGGALPPGLTFGADGVIRGTPSSLGTFDFSVEVEDSLGGRDEASLSIEVSSAANVIILSYALEPFPVGEPVSIDLVATGGVRPYDWSALSPLPPGLELTAAGRLVGTPTQVGRFPVAVNVTDSSAGRVRDTATIQVVVEDAGDFEIELTTLPEGQIRQNFEVVLTARGGEPPLHWSVATGSALPADFYLVDGDGTEAPLNAGLLYGFPIVDGVHAFTLRVEDAFGRRRETIYSLTVAQPQVDFGGGGCRAVEASGAVPALLVVGGLVLIRRRRRGRLRG